MIFLDTGYLIALFDDRDALHARALAWSKAVREPAYMSEYVLVEAINYLSGRIERSRLHRMLQALLHQTECVWVDQRLFQLSVDLHQRHGDKQWSLTDCVSFQLMTERLTTHALAFDHHFEQAGFVALLRRDP